MAKPAPTRPQRYQQLCREAARLLKVKASDPRVEHVATLRLARETFAAKLVSGQQVDPNVLLTLDGALRHYMPQEKLRVDIEFIEGPIEHCPKCGWSRDEPLRPPDPPPSAPPPTETKPSPPASSAPTNVVELPRPRSAGEPIIDTMRRFNQLRGYGVAPDGGFSKGNPPRVGSMVW